MKGSAIAAFVAVAITACGSTERTAQPDASTLTAQGVRTTRTFSRTEPFDFTSPCNGERVSGTVSFAGEGQLVTDATGATHFHSRFTYSGTYTGDRTGMAYTEFSKGQFHSNVTNGGAVNEVRILNGKIKASDGSTIMVKERTVVVVNANGEVRVERFPTEATALSCKRG